MVFTTWHVADVLTSNGTIVFPPRTIGASHYRSVDVYTGVCVKPGDTERSAILRAIEQFPTFLGQYSANDLRLKIREG